MLTLIKQKNRSLLKGSGLAQDAKIGILRMDLSGFALAYSLFMA
jgi:hypothetical protein